MHWKIFLFTVLLTTFASAEYKDKFDLTNYRLPTWAFPDAYYINVDLRYPERDTFRGDVFININVTEENHYELVLNVDPKYIDVNSSTIQVDTASFICDEVNYSEETQIMALTCMYDMWGNNTQYAQFEMEYTANYSSSPAGLCKHFYQINGTTKSVIFTQFEPTRFRKVFPGFDEPGFKAPMRLGIYHYDNLTVASNTLEREDQEGVLGWSDTTFNTTPPMSTYLLAFVAGYSDDWEHTLIPGTNNFRLFRQRIYDDYISIVSANAPKLLEKMGGWTAIEYESLGIPKMTFAALPGMGGAMENWGLITFSEDLLIDEGDRTTTKSLLHSLTVMAHELSHQWFGDYVTTNWWSETWLNEGFASYFEWYLADMLSTDDNDYGFDTLFVTSELQVALLADGPDALPLSNNDTNVNTASEISDTFGSISYSKGGSIVRMLRYALGEDVFKQGIQEYLKAKSLGNAKSSDLVEHLQAALPNTTDVDLETYLDPWFHQPGYPVVRTSFGEADANNFLISIDIYKFAPTLNETHEREESIWWVPISYITSTNPDPDNATYFWINPGRTFGFYIPQSDDSWGLVNAGARGFYRVDYDGQTLQRIINVLNNNETYNLIATENRAQLLDDLFNVAKYYTVFSEGYDDRPYQNAFKVADYLKFETEYLPWATFLKEVQYLLDEIKDELTAETLKEDVLALIEPQLVIPDSTNTDPITHSEILKRNLLLDWAAKLNQIDAISYVKTQYSNFLEDPKSVESNYRDVIICHGIRTSADPSKDYNTLMDLFDKSILPQEKSDIGIGTGCISNAELLKSYLESTLVDNPRIDKQYWARIFRTVYTRSPVGLDAAVHFIVENIEAISDKWEGILGIEGLLSAVATKITKPEHIKLLQNLLTTNSLKPSLVKAVEGAIEKADFNIEWIDDFGTEISSILVYNGGTVPPTTTNPTETTTKSKAVTTFPNVIALMTVLVVSFLLFK